MNIDEIARNAIISLNEDLGIPALNHITDDTNLFELIDSMGLLNLILETEDLIEEAMDDYFQLANEDLMDAAKSCFLKFSLWKKHIQTIIED
jgi:acyl carrier protein